MKRADSSDPFSPARESRYAVRIDGVRDYMLEGWVSLLFVETDPAVQLLVDGRLGATATLDRCWPELMLTGGEARPGLAATAAGWPIPSPIDRFRIRAGLPRAACGERPAGTLSSLREAQPQRR